MRKVFSRLVLAGSFSGGILASSLGFSQQTVNWPWLSQNTAATHGVQSPLVHSPVDPGTVTQNTVKQVAWDQLVTPAAVDRAESRSGLLGAIDFESIPANVSGSSVASSEMASSDVIVQELPWKAGSPQRRSPQDESGTPQAATSIPWASMPTGIIGPADFQPQRVGSTEHVAQVPRQSPVNAQPTQPEVSLIPFGPAKNADAATSVFTPSLADASSPSDRSEPESPYVLESVRGPKQQTVANDSLIPIDILPLSRLVSVDTATAKDAKFSTASMTGQMSDASFLFSKLNIENDFRTQASFPASAVRISADMSGYGAEWMHSSYAWVTPTFYHRPLYFEQPNLERYGIGKRRVLQPVCSAAHFFGSIGLMPYKLLTQHPGEHVYTLGNNRPGDCVPYQRRTLLGQSYPLEALQYFDDYSGYR